MQLAIYSSKHGTGKLFSQGSSRVYILHICILDNGFADASGNDKYETIPDYNWNRLKI